MAWEGDDKGPGQLNSLGPASQFTVSKSRRSNVPGRFRREVCWIYGGSFRDRLRAQACKIFTQLHNSRERGGIWKVEFIGGESGILMHWTQNHILVNRICEAKEYC